MLWQRGSVAVVADTPVCGNMSGAPLVWVLFFFSSVHRCWWGCLGVFYFPPAPQSDRDRDDRDGDRYRDRSRSPPRGSGRGPVPAPDDAEAANPGNNVYVANLSFRVSGSGVWGRALPSRQPAVCTEGGIAQFGCRCFGGVGGCRPSGVRECVGNLFASPLLTPLLAAWTDGRCVRSPLGFCRRLSLKWGLVFHSNARVPSLFVGTRRDSVFLCGGVARLRSRSFDGVCPWWYLFVSVPGSKRRVTCAACSSGMARS